MIYSGCFVLHHFNEDDGKNQATNLAEIYSMNSWQSIVTRSLEIGDEMLFFKDRPTSAGNFKLSSTPNNILAEISEISLIDLSANNFLRFKNFYFPCESLRKSPNFLSRNELEIIERSTMTQSRFNGLATLSINCERDRKLDFTVIIQGFAENSQENVLLVHTE